MLFCVRNRAVCETCISDCMLIRFVAQRLIKKPLHMEDAVAECDEDHSPT